MTNEERSIKLDRMLYTKDKMASNLILLSIVLDALYFVSIYQTDVGNYYYTWVIGASVVYNLLFMLLAFLASEGVKSRKTGFTPLLTVLGVMQFVRIFYLPAKAHVATVEIQKEIHRVMTDGQYYYVIALLAASGVLCIAGGIISWIHNKNLAEYVRSQENENA